MPSEWLGAGCLRHYAQANRGQTDELMKAIVDTETNQILGCSLLCHEAGEVISAVQMVMQAQMPYTVLRDGVLTHPTMTEGLNMLFSKL